MRAILIIVLFLLSCQRETDTENAWWTYRETGGWIQPRGIDLDTQGNGFVLTLTDTLALQSSPETLLRVNELAGDFPEIAGYYEADEFRTDQNYVTLIRRTATACDTVQVYDPEQAVLPPDLKSLIRFFQNLYQTETGGQN